MAKQDPKDRVREIIEFAFRQAPRTRSGKGWFINSSIILVFVSDIAGSICGKQGIAFIYTSLDIVRIVCDVLLHQKFSNDQERAEKIVNSLTAFSQPLVEALIKNAMDKYATHHYVYNRYFPDDKDKKKFVDYIIDNIFTSNGLTRADSVENFMFRIFPLLKTGANIQYRAEAIARELADPQRVIN